MWPLLAALLTAALYPLAYPPFSRPELLWLALVPLVWALEARPARAAAAGGVFGVVATLGVIAWVAPTAGDYFELPRTTTLALLGLLWLTTAAPFYAAAWATLALARPHLPRGVWLLLVPAAWVTAEFARSQLGLRSPWAKVGDAFFEWPRLRQIADATAVYGVSAVVVAGNVALAELLRAAWGRGEWAERARWPAASALAFAAILGATLGYGEWRLRQLEARPGQEPLEVVLVQGNVDPELRWRRTSASRILRRYGGFTREGLRGAPATHLVVWPENALQTPLDDPTYGPPLQRFVEASGVPLLVGAPRSEAGPEGRAHFNAASLLVPGREPLHYDKRRLLPFSESRPLDGLLGRTPRGDLDASAYTPGSEPGLVAVGAHSLGVLICFEAIYPEIARDLVAAGARVLVNVTNDGWFQGRGGAEQHLQQVVFRAVETRTPLLRAASTGVTAAIAPDGRIAARLDVGDAGALRHAVRPHRGPPSPYVRYGDLFAWSCAGALAAAGGIALRRGLSRRSARA